MICFVLLTLLSTRDIDYVNNRYVRHQHYQKDSVNKDSSSEDELNIVGNLDYSDLKILLSPSEKSNGQTPYWQDTNVVAVNKEKPRTSFTSFDNKESALNAKTLENSPYYVNLNGVWKFYYVDYPKDLPADVTDLNPDMSKWTEVNVPGNWEMQGYGVAIYTNIKYDFNPKNPKPPNLPEMVPVGVYRRTISISNEWLSTRDIYLQVGGAKTGLYVYVNGQEVGYSEDSKDPSDFLINKYVHVGDDNVVTLKVYKYSSGSYLDDQDMWRFGGIERDVYMYSQPKCHIQDFNLVSTLDDTYTNGVFRMNVTVVGLPEETEKKTVTVDYEIISLEKYTTKPLQSIYKTSKTVSVSDLNEKEARKGVKTFVFPDIILKNINKWSDEHPHLYKVLITLKISNGNSAEGIQEVVPFRFGFRRTDLTRVNFNGKSYPVLLFNGQQYKFKGSNIHEHNEHTGHFVTEDLIRKDIELLKQNNFNSLRLSHYPSPRRLYELCDEYGIIIMSECNIETHGMGYDIKKGGTLANNPDWIIPHIDRTKNMWHRLKNHACVNFFSLGNEAGNGICFYLTYLYLKHFEEPGMNRTINYERAGNEWNTDMHVPMYVHTDWLVSQGKNPDDRPVVLFEYSHAMGNSNGNFYRMWEEGIWSYPNLQGGFIWDWVDQGVLENGKEGRKMWTYGGDYGVDAPSDGNFNINGCVSPNRTEHPCLVEIKYTHQPLKFEALDLQGGIFTIKNRMYFTDTSDYEISYSVRANEKVLRTRVANINILPQNIAILNVIISDLKEEVATEYFVNFSCRVKTDSLPNTPKGFEVAHEQFKLPIKSLPRTKATDGRSGPELTINDDTSAVSVSSEKVSFRFDKKKATVVSYKVDGVEYIHNEFGMQPNLWRSPTDNDYGNGEPLRQQNWKKMSHDFAASATVKFEDDTHKVVRVSVVYNMVGSRTYEFAYVLYSNGVLRVEAEFKGTKGTDSQEDLPRVGLRFRVPESHKFIEYYGKGPKENYWDRKEGSHVGRYQSLADDLYFPYVRPQENGHHCDTKWLALLKNSNNDNNEENGGILIVGRENNEFEFNALRNTVEDFDDEDQTSLPRQWENFEDCFHGQGKCNHDENWAKNRKKRQHHIDDIVLRDFVEVCIDYKMMGLAGYDSWGDRPEGQYTLPSNKDYSIKFSIIPIKNQNEIDDKITIEYD